MGEDWDDVAVDDFVDDRGVGGGASGEYFVEKLAGGGQQPTALREEIFWSWSVRAHPMPTSHRVGHPQVQRSVPPLGQGNARPRRSRA
jgi:hypothetical protein